MTRQGLNSSHSTSPTRRRGAALQVIGVSAGVLCLVGASLATTANYLEKSWSWPWYSYLMDAEPLTDDELAVALTAVGLDARGLAACGCIAQGVAPVVVAARSHLVDAIQSFRDADLALGAAQKQVDTLTAKIQAGTGTQEDVAALAAAKGDVTEAKNDRQSLRTALFTAATVSLSANQKALIQSIQSQRHAGWDLPTEYLAGEHEEPDWVELRDALSHVRIAEKLNQQPDSGATNTILEAKADPDVAAAAQNLSNNLVSVTDAWNLAIYQ